MKIRARPRSRWISRSSFRYWAWMVTSRLVVGSSAMSSPGSQEMAMAPTIRCRIPPDIWCGYSFRRWVTAGILTDRSSDPARSRALRRETFS